MSKKYNLYLGKAGQLYVMSEFLVRGWNVAMPEVDTGDDIFVVEDENETFYRVQVKTANSVERKNGYSVQFNMALSQLEEYEPTIYYVFLIRNKEEWSKILLIPQKKLYESFHNSSMGSVYEKSLTLYFSIKDDKITCSNLDFTEYINNFNDFPTVNH
jgi:hypothetical protein